MARRVRLQSVLRAPGAIGNRMGAARDKALKRDDGGGAARHERAAGTYCVGRGKRRAKRVADCSADGAGSDSGCDFDGGHVRHFGACRE